MIFDFLRRKKQRETPGRPGFMKLYEPDQMQPGDRQLLEQLEPLDRGKPYTLRGILFFSMAVKRNFKRLTYDARTRDDGAFFWITDEHARLLGAALTKSLDQFGLLLTTFAGDGLGLIGDTLAEGVTLDEVTIAHKSADEVTTTEATGFGRLLTRARTRVVHLWAAEFVNGALDELERTLGTLGNQTLEEADICDISKPEPEDRIHHSGIEGLVARVLVVSGSNMSGKSTLLRTVGINTVLALAGAPVRAHRLAAKADAVG
jgi:hypothetical protein